MSLTLQTIFAFREEDHESSRTEELPSSLDIRNLSHTKKIVSSSSSAVNNTSFSESLKLTSRDTFHRSLSDAQSTTNAFLDTNDGSTGAMAPDGTSQRERLHDMLNTSFRLSGSIPLDQITETISIALIDPCNESYGKTGDRFAVNRSNAKRGIENLKYSYSDLSFTPDGCIWRGRIQYSCKQRVKSPSQSQTQSQPQGWTWIFVENGFDFSVQCQTVLTHQNDQDFADEKKDSGDSTIKNRHQNEKHYSIDTQAKFEAHHDRYIDCLKVISQTLHHIEYDVSRALYCLSLPEFPQGCGKETFRSVYQLNFKVT